MGELLQPTHLLIVLVVAFVLFGGKKLPELGAGLGKGIRSFKESMREVTSDHEKIDPPASKKSDDETNKQA